MELIDKLFWTSGIIFLITLHLIKNTELPSWAVNTVGLVFLTSVLALITFAFGKIWI